MWLQQTTLVNNGRAPVCILKDLPESNQSLVPFLGFSLWGKHGYHSSVFCLFFLHGIFIVAFWLAEAAWRLAARQLVQVEPMLLKMLLCSFCLSVLLYSSIEKHPVDHVKSGAPKKNTSYGNEVPPQDTTHLIQRPCYQRGSPCQDPAGKPPEYIYIYIYLKTSWPS